MADYFSRQDYISQQLDAAHRQIDAAHQMLLGNTLSDWVTAGIVAAAIWAALWAVRQFAASRYQKYVAAEYRGAVRLISYLISNTQQFFLIAVALYVAQIPLTLPDRIQRGGGATILILVLLQIGLWARRAVRFYLEKKESERGQDHAFAGSLDIIDFVARMVIWSLLLLVALDNLGVNITALLAGLGVGGVAVALALQNVLGDLFASLSIALDKPFVIGDRLVIDTFTGWVVRIGIKTTRLRSETGEQIILSNTDILKSRVRNFGRAQEQRALAVIRVSYDTPSSTLQEIPKLLENIVREQPNARFERCHLKTIGESSLLFELTYFVQKPSLHSLLDLQQAVNFRIVDEFRCLGVEFDYPTQRVVLAGSHVPVTRP